MTCPQCGCVFCVDIDQSPEHPNVKKYCSRACKTKAQGRLHPSSKRDRHIKAALFKRQHGACALCGKLMYQSEINLDHMQPRSHGGSNGIENLQLTHKACNRTRGDDCPGCPGCCPDPRRQETA